jgi:hypothetical protein
LAGPVSHLVNMSLSAYVFLSAFKTALIQPVYKGGGKARKDPASYRLVAILCALSKVLETVAKEDLETYMAANNILPTSQHGFRKGRSCTTALATAQAAWVAAKAKGKVLAVVGFDLSAAFDTVGREDLFPKMEAMASGEVPRVVQVLPHQREATCGLGRPGVRRCGRGVWGQAGVLVGPCAVPAPRLRPPPHPGDQGERRGQQLGGRHGGLGRGRGPRRGTPGAATSGQHHGPLHQDQRPRSQRVHDTGDGWRQGQAPPPHSPSMSTARRSSP